MEHHHRTCPYNYVGYRYLYVLPNGLGVLFVWLDARQIAIHRHTAVVSLLLVAHNEATTGRTGYPNLAAIAYAQ